MTLPNFFTQDSPYLSHPLLTPERTAREINFILSLVDLPEGARLLDVGCGFGRHSFELARLGYRVVGIDPSPTMIDAARRRSHGMHPSPIFHVTRAEDFTSPEPMDAALCLFTTLGQVEGDSDNRSLVFSTAQALLSGGHFFIEVPNRCWVVANLKTQERFGDGERYTDVSRTYDPSVETLTEVFTLVDPDGDRKYLLRYHLFDLDEISLLLDQAGFRVFTVYGGYGGAPFSSDSPLILVHARKLPF